MSKEFEEILIEKMNKELDNLVKNASKLKKLTAVSIIGMKQPTILLFLSILSDYKRVLKENEELKKYDIRNIKIDKDKIIRSPNFTRKEVDLMNLGIALNLNADKLFNEESEEDDI